MCSCFCNSVKEKKKVQGRDSEGEGVEERRELQGGWMKEEEQNESGGKSVEGD